ncbi:MAG: hypothetical protein U9O64_06390 [Campylobacterota bacterium]|nr:hypothetical protein [Campylobacterota bacterium]
MVVNTAELLTILYKNKNLIEELFEKRDRDIYLHDLSSDADLTDKIEYLVNVGILSMDEEPFMLNDTLTLFLENMLETNRRVEIRVIDEELEYLQEKISDYKNKALLHKQKEYLRAIKRILLRINKTVKQSFKVISERVTLEYTTQTNNSEKIIELNRYREKIEKLIVAEKEIDRVIIRELAFFAKAHNQELLHLFYLLAQTLRELRVSLVELQQIVIEYINKAQRKRAFFEKVLKLQGMIKNQEIKQRTDIELLIQEDRYKKLFIEKEKSFKTQLSLDVLDYYSDVFESRVKNSIDASLLSEKAIKKAPKVDENVLNAMVEYSNEVDQYALQRAFKGTNLDLFTFLDNKRYKRGLTLEEKLLIYAQMITLFEQEYEYTEHYKMYENYRVLDIYNKQRE